MAYDKEKAHEYYVRYRKKGLKKGRKKGTKKETKPNQVSLVGISTAGLNDLGRMQAALVKEKIKAEMNEALQKETDPVKKEAIRMKYQQQAFDEIAKLKSNSKYAKPKTQKTKTQKVQTQKVSTPRITNTGSSGSQSSRSNSGSSSGEQSTPAPAQQVTPTKKVTPVSSEIKPATPPNTYKPVTQENLELLGNLLIGIIDKIALLPDNKKQEVKDLLTKIMEELKKDADKKPKGYIQPIEKNWNTITDGPVLRDRKRLDLDSYIF